MLPAETKTLSGNRLTSGVDIILFTGSLKQLCNCVWMQEPGKSDCTDSFML